MTTEPASQLTAAEVVARSFCEDESVGARQREDCSTHVISQGAEPRWIIMGSPGSSLPVLRSWAPWKTVSRLRWKAVRIAAAVNALPMMPGVRNGVVRVDTCYWRSNLQCFPKEWNAVIHVGNPSHTRKAILFLIESGKQVVCAAKIPLAADASQAIFNEAEMLRVLRRLDYLPRVLYEDRSRGIVAQSWLHGNPVSRGFTEAHIELLNSLACGDGVSRVCDYRTELALGFESSDLPFDRSVLARGMDLLDCDLPLRRFVEHRDFAPWNLKWIRKGVLGLLDWEWAIADGLPWQDACRFFYLDDVHFGGAGRVWESINSNHLLASYRSRFDIPPAVLPALTMRYLLGELLMEWRGGNAWLASYAFNQIRFLLDAVSPIQA